MFVFQQALKQARIEIKEYRPGTLFDCTGLGAALKISLGEKTARSLFGASADFSEVSNRIAKESDFDDLKKRLIMSFEVQTPFGTIVKVKNPDNVPPGRIVNYDKALAKEFREWLESEVVSLFEKDRQEKKDGGEAQERFPSSKPELAIKPTEIGRHNAKWGFYDVFDPSEMSAVEGNGKLSSYVGKSANGKKVVAAYTGPYYYNGRSGREPTGYFKVGGNIIGRLFTHEFIGNKDIPAGQRNRAERIEADVSHIFFTRKTESGAVVADMMKSEAFRAKYGRENQSITLAVECWPAFIENCRAHPLTFKNKSGKESKIRDTRACPRVVLLKFNDGRAGVAYFSHATFHEVQKALIELGNVKEALNMDGGASGGAAGIGALAGKAGGKDSARGLPYAIARVNK